MRSGRRRAARSTVALRGAVGWPVSGKLTAAPMERSTDAKGWQRARLCWLRMSHAIALIGMSRKPRQASPFPPARARARVPACTGARYFVGIDREDIVKGGIPIPLSDLVALCPDLVIVLDAPTQQCSAPDGTIHSRQGMALTSRRAEGRRHMGPAKGGAGHQVARKT